MLPVNLGHMRYVLLFVCFLFSGYPAK